MPCSRPTSRGKRCSRRTCNRTLRSQQRRDFALLHQKIEEAVRQERERIVKIIRSYGDYYEDMIFEIRVRQALSGDKGGE